jgi:hypothetical protein
MLVVPAELVGSLRAGLHAALSFAAEEIATRGMDVRRERDPEFYSDALGCFDRARALLDVIGWVKVDPPVEVRFDLREHWQATLDALEKEIDVARDRVQEAAADDAERAERGEPPKSEATIQRVRALYEFTAMVREQADRLG